MMKRKNWYIAIFFFAFCILSLSVSFLGEEMSVKADTWNGLQYSVHNGVVTVTGYSGVEEQIVLPAKIEGCIVKSINPSVFSKNNTFTMVDLSETSIEILPDYTFYNCTNLKQVILPSNLKQIGSYSFGSCSNLEKIAIPYFCQKINSYAFTGCTRLKVVNMQSMCMQRMGQFSFYNCPKLEGLTIPDQCILEGNVFSPSSNTRIITSRTNRSVQKYYEEYSAISYYSDFTVKPGKTTYSAAVGKAVNLFVPTVPDSSIILWNQGSQILGTGIRCTVKVQAGISKYTCYVSNSVYVHSFAVTVNGKVDASMIKGSRIKGVSLCEKNDAIQVFWKRVSGIKGIKYTVYRASRKKGKYKRIRSTSRNQITDRTVKRGHCYYYKIKAYKTIQGKKYFSQTSVIKKKRFLGIPSTPKIKCKNRNLTWTRKKADGIGIYVKSRGIWIRVKSFSFTDYKQNSIRISAKTVTAVRVKLYNKVRYSGKKHRVYSKYSNTVKL